jgi:hypothetical protein
VIVSDAEIIHCWYYLFQMIHLTANFVIFFLFSTAFLTHPNYTCNLFKIWFSFLLFSVIILSWIK